MGRDPGRDSDSPQILGENIPNKTENVKAKVFEGSGRRADAVRNSTDVRLRRRVIGSGDGGESGDPLDCEQERRKETGTPPDLRGIAEWSVSVVG